jgi:hypothetical protein
MLRRGEGKVTGGRNFKFQDSSFREIPSSKWEKGGAVFGGMECLVREKFVRAGLKRARGRRVRARGLQGLVITHIFDELR